jgi:hypothetical protein
MTETIEHMGVEIQIRSDDDPTNPRKEWDHPGTHMVCWHRDYDLGDKHDYKDSDHFFVSLFGQCKLTDEQVRNILLYFVRDEYGLRDYKAEYADWRDRYKDKASFRYDFVMNYVDNQREWLDDDLRQRIAEIVNDNHAILELFLYDHSGITMRTGSFSCPWDSGQVGYIHMSLKDAAENWSTPMDWNHPVFYEHDKTTKTLRERAIDLLDGEVKEYDMYLTGDVWGYIIDHEGEHDSCLGFFGYDYCVSEAKSIAEWIAKKVADDEAAEAKRLADIEAHLATCSYEI